MSTGAQSSTVHLGFQTNRVEEEQHLENMGYTDILECNQQYEVVLSRHRVRVYENHNFCTGENDQSIRLRVIQVSTILTSISFTISFEN